MPPEVELGHEYALGNQLIPPNSALTEHREHADQFLDHFTREGLSRYSTNNPTPKTCTLSTQHWWVSLAPRKPGVMNCARARW